MAKHVARRRRPWSLFVVAAATCLGMSSVALGGTGAWFVDQSSSAGHSFTVGNVNVAATPASNALNVSGLTPGGSGYGLLTVTNPGSLTYRYAASMTTTGGVSLRSDATLEVKVQTNGSSCNAASYAANGTVVRSAVAFGSSQALFGNPSTGQQAGDRTVAPGATEYLCLKATLPTTAASTTQSSTISPVIVLDAEQTKNN